MDDIRIDARMALARYESSVAAYGNEAHFSIKDVHDVRAYIDQLEAALRAKDEIAYVIDSHGMTHQSFTIVYRAALGEKKDGNV